MAEQRIPGLLAGNEKFLTHAIGVFTALSRLRGIASANKTPATRRRQEWVIRECCMSRKELRRLTTRG